MLIKNRSSHLLRRAGHLRGRGGVGLRLRLDVPQPHRVQIPNLQRCEHCISTYPGVSVISLILCPATLDLRSFSARLDSASRSLEAASSSWRLAMLSSGTSSLWVLTSWWWGVVVKLDYFLQSKSNIFTSSDSQILPLRSLMVSSFSASFSLICGGELIR